MTEILQGRHLFCNSTHGEADQWEYDEFIAGLRAKYGDEAVDYAKPNLIEQDDIPF